MRVLPAVILSITATLSGCGGGGSSEPEIKLRFNSRFTIDVPVTGGGTYRTTDNSVRLGGDTFLYPENANCNGIEPLPIDLEWKNDANKMSGTATGGGGCSCDFFACIPYDRWRISAGVIPLEMGNNKIEVTGRAPGKSASSSITIVREEGPASLNFVNPITRMVVAEEYTLEVVLSDGRDEPMPDQVVDWSSSDVSIASAETSGYPTDQLGKTDALVTARAAGNIEIRARLQGTSVQNSLVLEIAESLPDPFDPVPPGEDLPSKPILLMPIDGAEISQEPPVEYCGDPPPHPFGHVIYFDWTEATSAHGVAGYHLYVRGSNAIYPIIDMFVPVSEYTDVSCGSFVIERNRYDWSWWVQAEDVTGQRGPASEEGKFQFGPCLVEGDLPCAGRF